MMNFMINLASSNVNSLVSNTLITILVVLVIGTAVTSIVSYFTFKKPIIPILLAAVTGLYASCISFAIGNILFFLIGINAVIITMFLLEAEFKHQKFMISIQGKNYASVEDYGHKDHYLYKTFKKIFSTLLVVAITIGLYLSIFVIFLQSINSSSIITHWDGATFKWYKEMFTNRSLNQSIIHTFTISILATAISTVLGTLFAIGIFYSSKKVREHILLMNNFPLLNADIVTGISLMLLFSFVVTLGIDPYFFGWKSMLLAHLFFCLPYVILNVMAKLKDLDKNLVDASLDLGLKPLKTLWRVIVPACKSGILSGMVLAFTMSFDDFVISYYTTGNAYDNLSIWIYSSIGRKSLSPVVYAFSILVIIVCILFLVGSMLLTNKKKGGK